MSLRICVRARAVAYVVSPPHKRTHIYKRACRSRDLTYALPQRVVALHPSPAVSLGRGPFPKRVLHAGFEFV
jgi:hypothetical protein